MEGEARGHEGVLDGAADEDAPHEHLRAGATGEPRPWGRGAACWLDFYLVSDRKSFCAVLVRVKCPHNEHISKNTIIGCMLTDFVDMDDPPRNMFLNLGEWIERTCLVVHVHQQRRAAIKTVDVNNKTLTPLSIQKHVIYYLILNL